MNASFVVLKEGTQEIKKITSQKLVTVIIRLTRKNQNNRQRSRERENSQTDCQRK